MLRPPDIIELAEWLRLYDFEISSQQLIAANRVLMGERIPTASTELAAWLAPVFCITPQQQAVFPELYSKWILFRGKNNIQCPLPSNVDNDHCPKPVGDNKKLFSFWQIPKWWLVAAMMALGLLMAIEYFYWHSEYELNILVVDSDGDPLYDATVEVTSRENNVKLRTDQQGRALYRYHRGHLPLALQATHSSWQPWLAQTYVDTVFGKMVVLKFSDGFTVKIPPSQAATFLRILPPIFLIQNSKEQVLNWLYLGALAIATKIIWWWLARRHRKGFLERLPATGDETEHCFLTATSKPLKAFWPELQDLGRELARRVYVLSSHLDIPATLKTTLRSGGLTQLVFGHRAEPEYVVLIDCHSRSDHLARLANEVVAALHAQNVDLHRYIFDTDVRFCYHQPFDRQVAHHGPQRLDQLNGRHQHAYVIILSDGRGMINPLSGHPVAWLSQLLRWKSPILMTPVPLVHWTVREWLLNQEGLRIVPLSAMILRSLGELVAEKKEFLPVGWPARQTLRPIYQQNLGQLLDSVPPAPGMVQNLLQALAQDLGEEGFAWLCGCAIYPELHWGITLALGEAVGQISACTSTRLSLSLLIKLAHLPWLRMGYMPDWLRQSLLANFPLRYELIIRKHLENFIEQIHPNEKKLKKPDYISIFFPLKKSINLINFIRIMLKAKNRRQLNKVFAQLAPKPKNLLSLEVTAKALLNYFTKVFKDIGWPNPTKYYKEVVKRLRTLRNIDQSWLEHLCNSYKRQQPRAWGTALVAMISVMLVAGLSWHTQRSLTRDLDLAVQAMRSGRHADAIAKVRSACGGSVIWLGCHALQSKLDSFNMLYAAPNGLELEQSVQKAARMAEDSPDDLDWQFLHAALRLRTPEVNRDAQKTEQAVKHILQIIEQAGNTYPEAQFYLGITFLSIGRYSNAYELLNQAVEGNNQSPIYRSARAYALMQQGMLAEAETDYHWSSEISEITVARLDWAVLLWHGPSERTEAQRLQQARAQLKAAQVRLRQQPPDNSSYDALPWQFDLGPGQNPLMLRSWAEKRCMADWLAASTDILAGAAGSLPLSKECGVNSYAMPRAVLRMLMLDSLPAPSRQDQLASWLKKH